MIELIFAKMINYFKYCSSEVFARAPNMLLRRLSECTCGQMTQIWMWVLRGPMNKLQFFLYPRFFCLLYLMFLFCYVNVYIFRIFAIHWCSQTENIILISARNYKDVNCNQYFFAISKITFCSGADAAYFWCLSVASLLLSLSKFVDLWLLADDVSMYFDIIVTEQHQYFFFSLKTERN